MANEKDDAQKANDDYHEGKFQTHDPVTGEKRSAPLPPVVDDALKGDEADGDAKDVDVDEAGDDYDSWSVDELRAEAEGLEVVRGDGGEGQPVKADIIEALRNRDSAP